MVEIKIFEDNEKFNEYLKVMKHPINDREGCVAILKEEKKFTVLGRDAFKDMCSSFITWMETMEWIGECFHFKN